MSRAPVDRAPVSGVPENVTPAAVARSVVARSLIAIVGWWAFSEGDLRSAWLAGATIAATVGSSLVLVPPGRHRAGRLRPLGLARFVPWFLVRSAAGALDVAGRSIRPGLPIEPGFVDYPFRLPAGRARLLVVFVVSLMPGILSAELGESHLRVHALDTQQDIAAAIADVERRVADLLGVEPGA